MRRSRLSLVAALAVASSAVLVGVPSVADAARQAGRPRAADRHERLPRAHRAHRRRRLPADHRARRRRRLRHVGRQGRDRRRRGATSSATVKRLQAQFAQENGGSKSSFFVGAGDLISGSPFESGVFKDEPTIEVLDAMGLDVSSVGNHEFDRGTEELRRISGCHRRHVHRRRHRLQRRRVVAARPAASARASTPSTAPTSRTWPRTSSTRTTGAPMLPPYQVFDMPRRQEGRAHRRRHRDDPGHRGRRDGVADVRLHRRGRRGQQVRPGAARQGVKAIGVLDPRGRHAERPAGANPNGCNDLTGPIVDINNRIGDQVDLIVSAHTHAAYNCLLPVPGGANRLVTSAGYYGRLVTDIRLSSKRAPATSTAEATYAGHQRAGHPHRPRRRASSRSSTTGSPSPPWPATGSSAPRPRPSSHAASAAACLRAADRQPGRPGPARGAAGGAVRLPGDRAS